MSEEQFKAFQEAVQADAGLQEKLKAAADADAVVAIAKAAGFVTSVEELQAAAQAAVSAQAGEISDEELESVTGGLSPAMVLVPAVAAATIGLNIYLTIKINE